MAKTKMFPNVATDEGRSEALKLARAWKNFKAGLENAVHLRHHFGRLAAADVESLQRLTKRLAAYVEIEKPRHLIDWTPEFVADAGAKFLAAWAEANGDDKAVAVRLYWRSLKIESWGRRFELAFLREVEARGEKALAELKPVIDAAVSAIAAAVESEPTPEPEPVAAPAAEVAAPSLPTLDGKEAAVNFVKDKEAFKAAMAKYAAGVLESPEGLKDYGRKMALMGKYSWKNVALCAAQLAFSGRAPEMIRPFSWWKSNGAMIRKGEHGLVIRVPIFEKELMTNVETGEEEEVEEIAYFGFGRVFDICQIDPETLGTVKEKLPSFSYGINAGECDAAALWNLILKNDKRIRIGSGQAAGFTNGKVIAVSNFSTEAAAVHTWAHECGHIGCGHFEEDRDERRGMRELEAEATAVLVCSALGIDASEHAAAYAAFWTGAELKAEEAAKSLDKAERAARKVLRQLTEWGWAVPGMEETAEAPKAEPKPTPKAPKAPKAVRKPRAVAAPVAAAAESLPSTGLEVKRAVLSYRKAGRIEEARGLLAGALKAKLISRGSYDFQMASL